MMKRSGSIYVARLLNARRIGNKLKRLQREGFHIFDENGEKITGTIEFRGFDGRLGGGLALRDGNCSTVYFDAAKDLDNGMHTPVAEFNAIFSNWVAVHPAQAKSIF